MTKSQKTEQAERLFCGYFAWLGNPFEAAVKAGFTTDKALCLLERADMRALIASYRKSFALDTESAAVLGLSRIAFGEIRDAMLLSGDSGEPQEPAADLFAISEIKRAKGGGCEIKFHDRAKALALLLEYCRTSGDKGQNELIEALEKGAAAVSEMRDSDEI